MFIITQVTSWLTKRDGKNRVGNIDFKFSGGRTYMLNANRIRGQKAVGSYTQFDFYDTIGSTKESPSVITCSASLADISTAINTEFTSKFVTLPFYKNNNSILSTEDVVIPFDSIAYVDSYRGDPVLSWVIYYINDFKRAERLCAYSMTEIYALAGGTDPETLSITWDSIVITFDSDTVTFDAV